MDTLTLLAPAWATPGDTTYVGQRAYTVVADDQGRHVVENVQDADRPGLDAAGYTPLIAPVPQPEPAPAPVDAPQQPL